MKSQDAILQLVAEHFHVSVELLRGPNQFRHITRARHAAMFLMAQCGFPYGDIAAAFERTRSTAINGNKRALIEIKKGSKAGRLTTLLLDGLWETSCRNAEMAGYEEPKLCRHCGADYKDHPIPGPCGPVKVI